MVSRRDGGFGNTDPSFLPASLLRTTGASRTFTGSFARVSLKRTRGIARPVNSSAGALTVPRSHTGLRSGCALGHRLQASSKCEGIYKRAKPHPAKHRATVCRSVTALVSDPLRGRRMWRRMQQAGGPSESLQHMF